MKLEQHESFPASRLIDSGELLERWLRARVSCLRAMNTTELNASAACSISQERQLLLQVSEPAAQEMLLRRVFEQSKKLGESAKWYFGIEWEVRDFWVLLTSPEGRSHLPVCFVGTWKTECSTLFELNRQTCSLAKECGSFICNYYREAMDGLVLGLSSEVRFVRTHSGLTNEEERCVDFWGDISHSKIVCLYPDLDDPLCDAQEQARHAVQSLGVQLKFNGVREGVLHYQWSNQNSSCGDRSKSVHLAVTQALKQHAPNITAMDISPRAVIDPDM